MDYLIALASDPTVWAALAALIAMEVVLGIDNLIFISILTNPTMGGCMASFAALGDITIAEPKALLGFAGPTVIKNTIRADLPEGFQRSEFLLAQGFLDLGLPVAGGVPGPHLANIVTVGVLSEDHYGTGDELYNRLYEHLVANGVKLSIRRGMLRFSLHVYNNMDDVQRVVDLTRDFLRSK